MTNIHDIARLSGYSVSTVSRVLNHQNYVSAKTRGDIEAVINKLDYVPNVVARNLSRGATLTIGVVLPHVDHPYFTQLLHGIMRAAFAANYHIVLLPSKWDSQLELKYLEALRQHAYDALIFTSHGLPLKKLAVYQRYGRIVLCENPHDYSLPAAYAQRTATYVEAFTYLKQRHHQRIAILTSRPLEVSATTQAMVGAYEQVYQRTLSPKLLYTGIITAEDDEHAGTYFAQLTEPVTAVLTNGDDIAVGMRRAYLAAQRPVPLLIGQEHQLSGEVLGIPTIDHHFEVVGARALELAISEHPQSIALPAELIINN
ncbi:LacI family DNA-binding transcriptional regulator [Lactiplantibacillus plantarum]|uniref:LacI family DNA-binding transcriptional regulator n=1 Tax=Lactiplantibacillus plantarum TaxID=1590 RepID=UPI0024685B78|nr:LacI family DNA-binding transcriptional regulator [Lactiplantibacillus plantarum]MDH5111335.1 LacI family DNA-binding transcriptional regulator [Lactiplantibacillus plantarum]